MSEVTHLQLNYEGLTRLNSDLETIPGSAESWEYNADATEITFIIRENLRYSDDSILNAKRFEYALLRTLDPITQAGLSSFLDAISGAYTYRSADSAALSPEKLVALRNAVAIHAFTKNGTLCSDYEQTDCLVLKISMDRPSPQMHTILSMTMAYPAKEELITSGGVEWWKKDAANQVGNGPYILRELEFNSSAYYMPNPNYWGEYGKVNIEYHYMSQSELAFETYKNGNIDIVSLLASELAAAREDPELRSQVMVYPGSCTYALMIQQDRPPFNDVMVRQAFAYALDRERYTSEILGGLGSPTLTWIPEGFPGYDAYENRWRFDAQKAREALAESSYQSAANLPSITFAFTETTRNRQRAEWLVNNYQENLGIHIDLLPMDPTTYYEMLNNPQTAPQLTFFGWCSDYPDPSNWLSSTWRTGTYSDRIGYSDPEVDALLDAADSETDRATRMQLYAEAVSYTHLTLPTN
jgi:oligopeptide transport system substrate-binding protein